MTFGYSAVVEIARVAGPLLGTAAVVRVLCIACALGIPLGSWWLARAAGSPPGWAAVLALPLAISWPLRVGLLPYALALPLVALGLAAAIWAGRDERARTVLALAACAVACYMAHPYAFVWLAVLATAAGLVLSRETKRSWLRIAMGIGVVTPMVGYDLLRRRLSMVEGADVTLLRSPTWWRPLPEALGHIVTRGLGVTGRDVLVYYEPLIVLLVAGCVIGWRQRPRGAARAPQQALIAAALLATLGTVVVPESNDNVFLLGSRVTVLGLLCWAVVAAPAIARGAWWLRAAAALSVTLALVVQFREVAGRAGVVASVLGPQGPEQVDGSYLPVQVARCQAASSVAWGDYDPLRHVWAYALGLDGVTPYLFAGSRYQPVWFRPGVLRDTLYGPNEYLLTDNELWRDPAACDAVMQDRLAAAASWPGAYDGVLVTGRQPELDRAIERSGLPIARRLAAGMYVLRRAVAGQALRVDFGTLAGAAAIRSGFYGGETIEGRTVQWSRGKSSALRFGLSGLRDDYQLRVRASSPLETSVAVVINDSEMGSLAIATSMSESSMYVPRSVLKEGDNEIRLSYANTFWPAERWHRGEARELAVMFDELTLKPLAADLHVDLGTPDGRGVLHSGFSQDEVIDHRTAVWSDGASSEIAFALRGDRVAHTLTLRAKGYAAQGVTVVWNDSYESRLTVPQSWSDLSVIVPAGVVLPGRNLLRLVYDSPARPADAGGRDTRLLAVAYDKMAVEPVEASVRVDLGTPAGRRYLRGGWGVDETMGDRKAIWSVGGSSDLRGALRASARCRGARWRVHRGTRIHRPLVRTLRAPERRGLRERPRRGRRGRHRELAALCPRDSARDAAFGGERRPVDVRSRRAARRLRAREVREPCLVGRVRRLLASLKPSRRVDLREAVAVVVTFAREMDRDPTNARGASVRALALAVALLGAGCRARGGDVGARKPQIGAYYYDWYTSEKWRREPAPDLPVMGSYDSRNPAVAQRHVAWAVQAGLDFFVVSWVGADTAADRNLREALLPQMYSRGIRLALLYETALALGLPAGQPLDFDAELVAGRRVGEAFVDHFDYLADRYLTHPDYLRYGQRPVIVIYLVRDMIHAAAYIRLVRQRLRQRGIDPFFVADTVFWAPPESLDWPMLEESFQALTAYNMYYRPGFLEQVRRQFEATAKLARKHGLGLIPNVMPGYDDTLLRGADRPVLGREDGKFYEQGWAIAAPLLSPQQPFLMITTFNEWHEGTEIEPSTRFGEAYLDLTRRLADATRSRR